MIQSDLEAGLAHGLLRFREVATEAEYQKWRQTAALPHIRLGHGGSLIAWIGGLLQLQFLLPGLVAAHPLAFLINWVAIVPVLVVGLFFTFSDRWRRRAMPFAAFVNALAGITIVWQAHRYLGEPGVAAGLAVTIAYFAAAIYRLPPRLTAPVVASYLILSGLLCLGDYRAGEMELWSIMGYEVLLSQTFVLAMLANTVIERTMRNRFRDGKIIERQTRALEDERAQISRFLSEEVTGMIRDRGIEETLKQQELELTAVCCDLRGFTKFTKVHGAEKMGQVLRDYYAIIVDVAKRHGGTVKDFAGDGALILIGAPAPRDDHAATGADLARELVREVKLLVAEHSTNKTPLGIGAGVATGTCAVGAIGSQTRLEYTAVGSAVNLSARLCEQAQDGEVLLSPETARAAGSDGASRALELKGFDAPVEALVEVAV